MSLSDPARIKALMHNIKGYDDAVWHDHAPKLMEKALTAKFAQNGSLLETLLATGVKTIIEASPHDKFWGVGIGLHSKDLFDKNAWKGKNIMGKCLMNVRDSLR